MSHFSFVFAYESMIALQQLETFYEMWGEEKSL